MGSLEEIKEKIEEISWAGTYIRYLDLYKRGIKKKAKSLLIPFINEFNGHNKNDRRLFIDLICKAAFFTNKYSLFLPVNLYREVVLPEVNEWLKEDPDNVIPNRWSDDLEKNKKAIEVDPSDQIALEIVADKIIGMISMNQHEINSGYPYDGNPEEDILLIESYERFLNNIQDNEKRNKTKIILEELKSCALLHVK